MGPRPGQEPCPYCGAPCDCDIVDVGIGYIQSGPYHCEGCDATERGPYDTSPEDLARYDKKTGWFPPKSAPGSSANMIDGRLATVHEATKAYKNAFADNPAHGEPGAVEEWWAQQRQPVTASDAL